MKNKAEAGAVAEQGKETETECLPWESIPVCGNKCGDGSVFCARVLGHSDNCWSISWWCPRHDQMRIAKDSICVECVISEINDLNEDFNLLSDRVTGLECRYSKKRRELSGRLRQDERDDVLADSYQRSASLGSLLRLLLQPQIILSGYAALFSGGTPRDWMADALNDCKRERIAQVRGEYQAARELLDHFHELFKNWKSRKPVQ